MIDVSSIPHDEWIGRDPTPESPYYPHYKVQTANAMSGVEKLPNTLKEYLMDLPDSIYTPKDDNILPRARLKKLLYWDCPFPLEQPLPTPAQMKSIEFDPMHPADPPDKERGYRIYAQGMVQQSQVNAQTLIRIELGECRKTYDQGAWINRQYVHFTLMTSYALDANMGTTDQSRLAAMFQALIEATESVNFGGVGGMRFDRAQPFNDKSTNVGYHVYSYIDWEADAPNPYYKEG